MGALASTNKLDVKRTVSYYKMFLAQLLFVIYIKLHICSSEQYTENLFIKPLPTGHIYAHFEFSFVKSSQLAVEKASDFKVFPRSIGEIINKYSVNQLHLSLTQGLWHHKKWGYPVHDAPTGAKLWAYFHPSISDISAGWFGLVNSLSGQYCASLNFIDSTYTIKPTFPLGERSRNSSLFRYGSLPRETVCTENLTPWTKLLPCDNKAGLATLFRAVHLFNSNYLSLGLDIRTQCQGKDSCNTLLQQTLDVVLDPLRTSYSKKQDWSFFHTFSSKLMQTCPLAAETKIFVDLTSNQTFPFSLSPKPTVLDPQRHLAVYNADAILPLNVAASYASPHVHWLIPPPFLHSSCHVQGQGVERGGLFCQIHNSHPTQEMRVYVQAVVPWILRVYHHTLRLTAAGCHLSPDISLYQPALDRKRPHVLELELRIPPRTTAQLELQFDRNFLKWTEYPPDPNHGFYVGSCLISSSLASHRNMSFFPGSWHSEPSRLVLYTNPLLVSLPTPDFSMPYNVICLVSTVVAFAFGPLHNTLTKRMKEVDQNKPSLLRRIKNRLISLMPFKKQADQSKKTQ